MVAAVPLSAEESVWKCIMKGAVQSEGQRKMFIQVYSICLGQWWLHKW